MRCEICFGYLPPFNEIDQRIYKIWDDDRKAAETVRLNQWRNGQP